MHKDHRQRYHVRPAAEVYPGDRISTDPTAIEAAKADDPARYGVDWEAVEADSRVVRDRTRTRPTRLEFMVPGATVSAATYAELLVIDPKTQDWQRDW